MAEISYLSIPLYLIVYKVKNATENPLFYIKLLLYKATAPYIYTYTTLLTVREKFRFTFKYKATFLPLIKHTHREWKLCARCI